MYTCPFYQKVSRIDMTKSNLECELHLFVVNTTVGRVLKLTPSPCWLFKAIL